MQYITCSLLSVPYTGFSNQSSLLLKNEFPQCQSMAVFDCGKNPEWALDDHAPERWICDIINNILLVIYVLPPIWLTHIVKNRPVKNRGWTGTTQSHVSFSFTFALMGKKITAASIGCKYYSWSALSVGKKEVNKIKASCITFPLFSLCSTAHEEICRRKMQLSFLTEDQVHQTFGHLKVPLNWKMARVLLIKVAGSRKVDKDKERDEGRKN